MLEFWCVEKFTFLCKIGKNHWVGFFNKYTCVCGFACHFALSIYKLYKWEIIDSANSRVIFAKSRSGMNDTCSILHSYVTIAGNKVCLLILLFSTFTGTSKQRLVFLIFKLFTLVFFNYFICFFAFFLYKCTEYAVKESLGHVICVAVNCLNLAVNFIWVYTKSNVRRQCPRCCGPSKKICVFIN